VHALAFSPQGRHLAAFGRKSQALIQELVKPHQRYELPMTTPGARGLFSHDENTLFMPGKDGTLQTWPFAEGGNAMDVPKTGLLTSQRFIVSMDGQWLVSQANPSAREPLQGLTPFGPIPDPAPAVVAVDAAGERLAYIRVSVDAAGERPVFHNDGGIILRRRDKQTGKIIEETLPPAGDHRPSRTSNPLCFNPDRP